MRPTLFLNQNQRGFYLSFHLFVFYLLSYIAAKAQSKMAPDERFET